MLIARLVLLLTQACDIRKFCPLANMKLRVATHEAFSVRNRSVWTSLNPAPP